MRMGAYTEIGTGSRKLIFKQFIPCLRYSPIHHWKDAINQFIIQFEDRVTDHL